MTSTQGEQPVVAGKRKQPEIPPDDDLKIRLSRPCLCKQQSPKSSRVSCHEPFLNDLLFGELKSWREGFRGLHKLDQDKYVACH